IYLPKPFTGGKPNEELSRAWVEHMQKVLPPGTVIRWQGKIAANDVFQSLGGARIDPSNMGAAKAAPSAKTAPGDVPMAAETSWRTGEPKSGQSLGGVPFAPAPPKFWKHVKDVNIHEPDPVKHVDRAGILVQEDDGRVWIVEPTGHFGNRNHTIPGG